MKTVIVFESMFGNTEQLAREIGDGLAAEGGQVALADVRHVRPADFVGCDLVVIGAPTHALSLSRPSTRADAVRQGASESRAAGGVREWLADVEEAFPAVEPRPCVAVFDTRIEKVQHWPGSAARKAARVMRGHRFEVIDHPTSFYVVDVRGPLVEGERERARVWARRLQTIVRTRPTRKSA
ncbi:flavodoxin family protein [Nocardioides sp. MAHUQ-72]|uniref:flavodoxin family protein n=1 Tax=unclassified Nocardioides TaxID=2615069 RepID=UPI003613BFB2